jgi:DNA-binding PadR family transcriptional regulator
MVEQAGAPKSSQKNLLTEAVCKCILSLKMKLSEREMQLLALVAEKELPGREVAQSYHAETGRAISYGTLYTTFRRLKDDGLVSVRDDEDADGRVRYFRITGAGERALNQSRAHHRSLAAFGLALGGAT